MNSVETELAILEALLFVVKRKIPPYDLIDDEDHSGYRFMVGGTLVRVLRVPRYYGGSNFNYRIYVNNIQFRHWEQHVSTIYEIFSDAERKKKENDTISAEIVRQQTLEGILSIFRRLSK